MTSRSPRSIVFPLTVCFAVSPLVAAAANVAAPKVIRTGPAVQPAAVGVNALVNPGVGVPVTAAPFGAAATPSLPAYQTPSLLAAPMVEGEVGFAMPESAAVVPAVAPAPFKAEPGQGDAKSAFSEVKEAGQALLEGKAVESDGAGSAPQVLTRVFDGSKLEVASAKGEVQGAFSLSASQSHLGKPPKEALPDIDPQWKPAALSQDRRLRYRVTGGSVKEFGEDVKIESRKEDLKLVEDAAGFAESKLEGPLQDKVSARAWTAPSGIKAVASLRKSDNEALAWLDEKGAVRFHNFSDNKTYKVEAGARVDLIAASAAGRELYVLTGGSLQKWDLLAMAVVKETLLVGGQPHQVEDAVSLSPAKQGSDDGIRVVTKSGRLYWIKERLIEMTRKDEIVDLHGNLITGVESAGGGLYLAKSAEGTRIYSAGVDGEESLLEEVGTLPLEVKALARSPVRSIYFAVTSEGLVEYESKAGRYMVFKVPGLSEALATGLATALDMRWESIKISVGDRVFEARIAEAREFLASRSAEVRLWSQDNPMYVEGGYLRIGSFKFKIAAKTPATRSWSRRAWNKALRLFGRGVPDGVLDLGISEMDWRALNLPSNKRLIYDTLKGFSLNQHILYIGETGGGKTWIATMLAKLTGNDLWMVSMNEYTRNKDLIARETFGEEGKNKTGLTASTVLRWMVEGGILVLDELHKPLEGIAVLNNILQNGEYRMSDGRVIKYDKTKSWVIGTMNPVKPPYKGEPPSGELSSRFGMTLDVKYLPPEEEEALLAIFFERVPRQIIHKLVSIANDLRKIYPEILPLPIAPRTLMHIVDHIQRFPTDDVADIFTKTYNPSSIVEDPAIAEAISRVLQAHDLSGTGAKAQAEEKPKTDDGVPF